ncbi:MAG TPA: pyridoxal-phosphate dependent enzyme, partial [Gaiellaceae bacterium]|nr:pyridoxal-phosphate dependent enzyme [Gaiellaceae bacterium]
LGAEVVPVTHEEWWQAMVERGREGVRGLFVHPVADEAVMAGNGTIGLELAEDAPEFDSVVIPWGGGGLTTGIASALDELRPEVRVVTAEPETAAPLAVALRRHDRCLCIVSGGNVDAAVLSRILAGETPGS